MIFNEYYEFLFLISNVKIGKKEVHTYLRKIKFEATKLEI